MATGLGMPVGVNNGGGARLESGDENNDKIVRLALGEDDNENAFQQNIGLGAAQVFGIADQQLQAQVTRRLFEVFRRFRAQKRFILRENTIKWETNSAEQELTLFFKYVDIESDEEKDFRQGFAAASGSTSSTVSG